MSLEQSSDELRDLKAKVGLRDLSKITLEQFAGIQKMAAEGDVTVEQMKQLVTALPHFVELQKQTIEGLKQVVDGVQEAQREALQSISQALEGASKTLQVLAEKVESDETRLKLAEHAISVGRLGLDLANIISGMNRDNNSLWRTLAMNIGVLAVALVFVFSGGRLRV